MVKRVIQFLSLVGGVVLIFAFGSTTARADDIILNCVVPLINKTLTYHIDTVAQTVYVVGNDSKYKASVDPDMIKWSVRLTDIDGRLIDQYLDNTLNRITLKNHVIHYNGKEIVNSYDMECAVAKRQF